VDKKMRSILVGNVPGHGPPEVHSDRYIPYKTKKAELGTHPGHQPGHQLGHGHFGPKSWARVLGTGRCPGHGPPPQIGMQGQTLPTSGRSCRCILLASVSCVELGRMTRGLAHSRHSTANVWAERRFTRLSSKVLLANCPMTHVSCLPESLVCL
jgi:hypothetical protein